MSYKIQDELEDQEEFVFKYFIQSFLSFSLLDDLGATMQRTENRMDNVMKRLARVTNLDDDSRQWTAIFFLIGLILFLLMLLIAF